MATYSNAMLARGANGAPITLSTADIVNWELASEQHKVSDNSAAAFEILQGTDSYFKVVTSNSSEAITFGNTGVNPSVSFLGTGAMTLGTTSLSAAALTSFSAGSAVTTLSTLALGGATIGTHKLAITGTADVSSHLTVGGNLTVTGNLTVDGTTTTVNSTTLQVDDNTLVLNSGPGSSKDAGILFQRYVAEVNSGDASDVTGDTAAETGTAQAGAASTITLANAASSSNSYYDGWYIKITGGTGSGQVRKINSYVGATRVATVNTAWQTVPDNTSTYSLFNRVFIAMFYDESADELVVGAAVADSATALVAQDQIKVHVGGLTADDAVAFASTLAVTGNTTLSGTLGVTGAITATADINANGNIVGDNATSISGMLDIDGTGDLTMGTITMTGFSVDADGDAVVKSLNASSGGITNAGAIAGATTIAASGNVTISGALTLDGASKAHAITGASSSLRLNDDLSLYLGTDNDVSIKWMNAFGALMIDPRGVTSGGSTFFVGRVANSGASGAKLSLSDGQVGLLTEVMTSSATGTVYGIQGVVDNTNGTALTSGTIAAISALVTTKGGAGESGGFYYGVKVENITETAGGTPTLIGMEVGTGYDTGLIIKSGGIAVQSGALNLSGGSGITNAGAVSGVTTFSASGAMTLSANAATITHSGTTSLTIASTNGTVIVESVTFDGGAISNASSIDGSGDLTMGTITMTGFSVNGSGAVSATGVAVGGALSGATTGAFSGNVTVGGTLGVTGVATFTAGFDSNAASTVSSLTIDGTDQNRYLKLTSNTVDPDQTVSLYVLDGELYFRETASGGTNLVTQITSNGGLNIGDIALSLDDAYNNGRTVTVDAGPIVLNTSTTNGGSLDINPSLTSETAAQIDITWAAGAYTGTPIGLRIDYSGMTSLSNADPVRGISLIGKTNAGAGDSVGITVANFDQAADLSGSVTVTGGAVTLTANAASSFTTSSGALTLTSAAAATWSTGAGILTLSGAAGVTVTSTGGTLTLDGTGQTVDLNSAALDIDASGAITIDGQAAIGIESSGGAITIGGNDVAQAISIGTNGARAITIGSATAGDTTSLDLKANGEVIVTTASNLVLDATGEIVTENDLVANGAISDGDMLSVDSTGKLVLADANSHTHIAGAAAAAAVDAAAVKLAGMPGSVVKVSTNISALSKGVVVYLSETAGAVTSTPPSTSGAKVIRAGIVVDNGTGAGDGYILFQPQFMYEVA